MEPVVTPRHGRNDRIRGDAGAAADRRPQTERTVVAGRRCAGCDVSIDHKRPQARYCNDRCRAATHRREREERLRTRLEALEIAAGNLHAELKPATTSRPHHD